MKFYKNMRLAGAVMMIAGALMNKLALSLVGFAIQYLGLLFSVDHLESLEGRKDDNIQR